MSDEDDLYNNDSELNNQTSALDGSDWWSTIDFRPDQPHYFMLGDHGTGVERIQQKLIDYGANLTVDGVYGSNTKKEVQAAQLYFNLAQDGIFGEKTARCLEKGHQPLFMTQMKVDEVAQLLQTRPEVINAVSMVESRGDGFWSGGAPVILYERHWMYRLLGQHTDLNLKKLIRKNPNIVNNHPGGYVGGIREYTRLRAAKELNESCALQSCSWGCYQIMGFHWSDLKYDSIVEFVMCMKQSEDEHLEAFARFIENDRRLLTAIQKSEPDFLAFAKAYNGPNAVRENNYPEKMRRIYNSLIDKAS